MKIDLFIMCAFQANHGRKDSFFYILDKKEFFLEQKKEVSKLRKNCNFSKGNQSMVFVKKTSFTMGAFWANHATKDSFRIFHLKESKKLKFSKRDYQSMFFFQKIDPFTTSALWANQARKDSIQRFQIGFGANFEYPLSLGRTRGRQPHSEAVFFLGG